MRKKYIRDVAVSIFTIAKKFSFPLCFIKQIDAVKITIALQLFSSVNRRSFILNKDMGVLVHEY
jgi:hypothetical protein